MTASPVYSGRSVAMLTQHGKVNLLAPVLEPELGCRIKHVTGFDTDQLGTFTREIPRAGTQLEAARRKARLGMQMAGMSLGLASEGAFGPDPIAGMLPWNVEYVVWIDDELGLEVVGRAHGPGCFAQLLTTSWDQAVDFVQQNGFPAQQLILRPSHSDDPRIKKNIRAWAAFSAYFRAMRKLSSDGQVFVETDGRAHANPMRQKMIIRAAEDLSRRLCTVCLSCNSPGFGHLESLPGLPCAACDAPTSQPFADQFGCPLCGRREIRIRTDEKCADPRFCPYCNP